MIFDFNFGLAAVLLPLLLVLAASSLRVLREYQRGVVFQLGRFWKVKGPGLVLVIPGIQQMVRVDLRVVTMDVPPQDVISRDNVSVKVNAVVFFRVVDPQRAIIQVQDYLRATSELAQTTLRVVLGKHELDEMLAERERLNLDVQQILDAQTDAWGIKVTNVEIKHIDLNETMIRAIARQAEAERERRAKVIHAEGEKQASAALLEAARMLAQQPEAMQLRYLQTMTQVAGDRASTVVLPLPLDLLGSLMGRQPAAPARESGVATPAQWSQCQRRLGPSAPVPSVRPTQANFRPGKLQSHHGTCIQVVVEHGFAERVHVDMADRVARKGEGAVIGEQRMKPQFVAAAGCIECVHLDLLVRLGLACRCHRKTNRAMSI